MARNRNLNSGGSCPPGVFCLSPGFLVLLGLLAAVLIFFLRPIDPTFIYQATAPAPAQAPVQVSVVNEKGDDRYTRAPRPLRLWDNGPEYPVRGSLPGLGVFNQPTQGLPEAYQSMGVLQTENGQILPLYGRRTAYSNNRYNYYTRTDTNNPVPLPINYKRRDCQDSNGCDELFSGETIKILPTGGTATATIYQFDGPLYVPGLL
jgi:hypothetical protein